jgi:formyltetrahydrofolate-dependent phosphoribosylglycinamide formyltransferase
MDGKGIVTIRLGVLLSGGGRTMLNMLEKIRAGELPAEVAVVIASRQCKGAERAAQAGLDVEIVPYKEINDTDAYSRAITEILDAAGVDLVCEAGLLSFYRIPPRYDGKVMNIHPALLPLFGGKGFYGERVHRAVLASGMKVSGCTVHFATNEYDAGPIIVQRTVEVAEGDTPETLAARVFEQECVAYPEAIRLFAQGRLRIDGRVVRVLPKDT